jgi:hypothetical protein
VNAPHLRSRVDAEHGVDAPAVVRHDLRVGRAELEGGSADRSLGHQVAEQAGQLGRHLGRVAERQALGDEAGSEQVELRGHRWPQLALPFDGDAIARTQVGQADPAELES